MTSDEIELDFGLAPGESFEPDSLPDDLDLSGPYVQTVLGPIDPGALGLTVVTPSIAGIAEASGGDDPMAIVGELEAAYAIGLRSLIVFPVTSEPVDSSLLSWVAARSPVHLVVPGEQGTAGGRLGWAHGVPSTDFTIIDSARDASPEMGKLLLGLTVNSGPSLSDVLHALPLHLMELGFSARQIREILVDNPAAAVTIRAGDVS